MLTWYNALMLLVPVFLLLLMKKQLEKAARNKLEAEFFEVIRQLEEKEQFLAMEKKALELQNRASNKLLSFMSHELRHPLMYLENLSLRIDRLLLQQNYHQLQQLNSDLAEATRSLGGLLNKLLDWNTRKTEHLPQDPQVLHLDRIIDLILKSNQSAAAAKGVTIRKLSSFDRHISVDKVGLIMVLQNLVGNAIKFTPKNGEIWLLAKHQGNRIRVIVQDSGVGMTDRQLASMGCQELSRSSNDEAREEKQGYGMGLAISREIMKLNHGRMIVRSRRDVGTTFHLFFPAAAE